MVPGSGQEALAETRFGAPSQDTKSLIKWEQFLRQIDAADRLLCYGYVRQGDASMVPQRSASQHAEVGHWLWILCTEAHRSLTVVISTRRTFLYSLRRNLWFRK